MKSSIKRLPSKRNADEEKLPKKARVQYSFEFETKKFERNNTGK